MLRVGSPSDSSEIIQQIRVRFKLRRHTNALLLFVFRKHKLVRYPSSLHCRVYILKDPLQADSMMKRELSDD